MNAKQCELFAAIAGRSICENHIDLSHCLLLCVPVENVRDRRLSRSSSAGKVRKLNRTVEFRIYCGPEVSNSLASALRDNDLLLDMFRAVAENLHVCFQAEMNAT